MNGSRGEKSRSCIHLNNIINFSEHKISCYEEEWNKLFPPLPKIIFLFGWTLKIIRKRTIKNILNSLWFLWQTSPLCAFSASFYAMSHFSNIVISFAVQEIKVTIYSRPLDRRMNRFQCWVSPVFELSMAPIDSTSSTSVNFMPFMQKWFWHSESAAIQSNVQEPNSVNFIQQFCFSSPILPF